MRWPRKGVPLRPAEGGKLTIQFALTSRFSQGDLPGSLRPMDLNGDVTGFRDNEFLDFDVNPAGSKLAEN